MSTSEQEEPDATDHMAHLHRAGPHTITVWSATVGVVRFSFVEAILSIHVLRSYVQ